MMKLGSFGVEVRNNAVADWTTEGFQVVHVYFDGTGGRGRVGGGPGHGGRLFDAIADSS
jgi:hypothetical protein